MAEEQVTIRRYNWADVPTLRNMYYSDAPHQFVQGPFGSGKSSAMVAKILKYAAQQKPSSDGIKRSRWAIVRNSFRQLNDTTIVTVKYWLPESVPGNDWHETKHNYYITSFPGIELELNFRALDRPDDVANLLSLELTGAWLNEFREIHKDIYEGLDGRVGRYPPANDGGCSWFGIIADSNPPNKGSYWYRLLEEKRHNDPALKDKIKSWKQPSGLSPRAENVNNLPKNYYQNLSKGKDQLYIDVYIHGKYGYTREGKPVFELYDDNRHVSGFKLEPVPGVPVVMGWDFALNPTCLLGQIIRGQLAILDEIEGADMGIERMIDNLLMPLLYLRYRGYKFQGFGDPSGNTRSPTDESTCYKVLKTKGFNNVEPAPTNAITPRLGAVNHFLSLNVGVGDPALLISPHCTKLREALNGGYCFKKVVGKDDEFQEEPLKNQYSHIADAFEALCMFVNEGRKTNDKDEKLHSLMGRSNYVIADAIAAY